MRLLALCSLMLSFTLSFGTQLTFELPDNEKQCFYEEIDAEVKFDIEFQVIAGGNYDVDCSVTDPTNSTLYREKKKQYGSFSHTTTRKGVYKICFSNEFSTFSHKTVYLDFQVGQEVPLLPEMNRATAVTQAESALLSIHETLKSVIESQTWYRLRQAQHQIQAEHLHKRVSYWSMMGEAAILVVVSIGQVLILKSFFNERKTRVAAGT